MKKVWIFPSVMLVLLALMLLAACQGDFTANAYKTLRTSAEIYDASMKTAADLYKQELVSNEEKAQIVAIARKYRLAYLGAGSALAAYEKTNQADHEEKARIALAEFSKVYMDLMTYLRPMLLRQKE